MAWGAREGRAVTKAVEVKTNDVDAGHRRVILSLSRGGSPEPVTMVCRSGPMGEEVMWNDGWGRPKPSAAKDTAPRARAAPARDEEGREPTEEWYPDAWKRLPQPRRRRRLGGQK